MRVTARIALIVLVAIWALLVYAVHGYQSGQSRPAQATLGIGIALLSAASLGMVVWLIYLAIQATPEDPRKAASYGFRWMLVVVVSFVAGADALSIIVGQRQTAGGMSLWSRLVPIHVLGSLGLAVVLYFRFRSLRIHARPERSADVRRKFERFEGLFARIAWGLILLDETMRDFTGGFRQRAIIEILIVLSLVATAYIKHRLGLRLKGKPAIPPTTT